MGSLKEYIIEIRVNAVIEVSIKADSLEDALERARELNENRKLWDFKPGVIYSDGTDEIITVRDGLGWDGLHD